MFGFDTAKLLMIGGAVLLLSALGYKAYDSIGDAREAKVRAEWQASIIKEAEQSREVVAEALARAKATQDQENKDRQAREQVEREAQQNSVERAVKKSLDLERRYRDALIHNSSCAAQMEMVILCPVE